MQLDHLTFPVTLTELVSRIRHYIEVSSPLGFRHLHITKHDPMVPWEKPTNQLSFTLYGVSADGAQVPLLEFYGIEGDGYSSASIGCDRPGNPEWLREMRARLRLARSLLKEEGWPEWLSTSSDDLEAPLNVRAGELVVLTPEREEAQAAPAEKPQTAAPAAKRERPKKAKNGGRKTGTKNTPVEKQERYCEEYLRLHFKCGTKFDNYIRERKLVKSTFSGWLTKYKEEHPDWETKARSS